MSEHEQERYGTVRAAEPIPVLTSGPFVASTPNATSPPEQAMQAFNAMVHKDLVARREQQH